jgi:uncharacterized membrane protein
MKKGRTVLYWAATFFLAVGMLAGGVQQMLQTGGYVDIVGQLGYPIYLLSIIGVWKILGVIAVLIPKLPVVKEWAYAGFFFVMSGAVVSHMAMDQPVTEVMPSLILLVVTFLSWYYRPADRKINSIKQ